MRISPQLRTIVPAMFLFFSTQFMEAQETLHFGAQASLLNFQGDVKSHLNNSPGNEVGIHLGIPLNNGQEIRPSLSWRTPPQESSLPTPEHMYGGCAGIDYLFYPAAHQNGLYLMAGVSAFKWFKNGGTPGSPVNSSYISYKDTSGVEPSVGVGYRFTRILSLESRLAFSHMDRSDGQRDSAPFISFGVVIH